LTFIAAAHAPILPVVANGGNSPIPYSVGVTLLGGVARRVPAHMVIPTTTTSEAKTNLDLIAAPFSDERVSARVSDSTPRSLITKRQNI
jgi:hypothetical protein